MAEQSDWEKLDRAETEGGEEYRTLPEDDEEDVELEEALKVEANLENDFPISGEPELIAQIPTDELSTSGSEVTNAEVETPHLTSTVCDCCLELNLTHPAQIIRCEHCEQAFCFHFASSIDARYCVNCMSDISVTKQTITKEYIHRDTSENITSVYRRRAREVKISGLSWLFAQRKIVDLSDVELDMNIEYHRNLLVLLIDEQERRRTARMHRYAGMKAHIPSPSGVNVTNSTQTTVKKTRTISKNKAQEQLAALLGTLKGVDVNAIAAILKGVK